jgi:hypothetical protein
MQIVPKKGSAVQIGFEGKMVHDMFLKERLQYAVKEARIKGSESYITGIV